MSASAQPANAAVVLASPLGMFPVAACPKYQAPMSVSWPICVNMAALGPTLETSERKDPKYE